MTNPLAQDHQCYPLYWTLVRMCEAFRSRHQRYPAYILLPPTIAKNQDECDKAEVLGVQVMAHTKAKGMAYLGPIGGEWIDENTVVNTADQTAPNGNICSVCGTRAIPSMVIQVGGKRAHSCKILTLCDKHYDLWKMQQQAENLAMQKRNKYGNDNP